MLMDKPGRASLESQLGNEPCAVCDTEDIFWLREADDYQSKFQLGSALAAQYRFRDAVETYETALSIRTDDWRLWYSLSGANLTLRRFEQANSGYRRCLALGAPEKTVAYPIGVACYLQREYRDAATWFEKCLPCGDEMAIAVIYWHTLNAYRANLAPALLGDFRYDMDVGHHTAYQLAVSVFRREMDWETLDAKLADECDALNYVIAMYGLCGYLDFRGRRSDSKERLEQLLKRESVWPCISYLAAWGDMWGQ